MNGLQRPSGALSCLAAQLWSNVFGTCLFRSSSCLSRLLAVVGYEDGQEEKEKQEAGRARLVTIPELLDHLQEHAQAAATDLAKDTNAQVTA